MPAEGEDQVRALDDVRHPVARDLHDGEQDQQDQQDQQDEQDDFAAIRVAGLQPQLFESPEFPAILKQFLGQVVLVDVWALWCPACLEGLPATIQLARRQRAAGLIVLAVNADGEQAAPRAAEYLASLDASTELNHYGIRSGLTQAAMQALEIDGGLPAINLYDRSGRLRQSFGPEIDLPQVEVALRQLLAE